MHFLSHYYTELPQNDPYFTAGLIIPDLTPRFARVYNSIIKNSVSNFEGDLGLIQLGVKRHYEGDKWFHNSEPFLHHQSLALEAFLKEGLNRNRLRLSVLAHLTVELMLDRQLVLENEALCEAYYGVINNCRNDILTAWFNGLGLLEEKKDFLVKFNFFRERRFLFLFKGIEHIVYGLNRIYGTATHTSFTDDEKARFEAALNNIDTVMRYSWQELLKG
ncbi:MAG TPA: hypothetical protein VG603_16645 [Chitinophagales bacterium]|nr:hypothetical protein [Chitinophagales bacterium]